MVVPAAQFESHLPAKAGCDAGTDSGRVPHRTLPDRGRQQAQTGPYHHK
jgi:hypothetical protein